MLIAYDLQASVALSAASAFGQKASWSLNRYCAYGAGAAGVATPVAAVDFAALLAAAAAFFAGVMPGNPVLTAVVCVVAFFSFSAEAGAAMSARRRSSEMNVMRMTVERTRRYASVDGRKEFCMH